MALPTRVVHIMAGADDIPGDTGPTSDRTIVDDSRTMILLAKADGIAVVFGGITPSSGVSLRPGPDPSARIVRVAAAARARVARRLRRSSRADDRRGGAGCAPGWPVTACTPTATAMRPSTDKAIAQADRRAM